MANKQQKILDFWFDDIDNHPDRIEARNKLWWSHDPDTDEYVKKSFHMDVIAARNSGYQSWHKMPEGNLALIILLDQFSRHIYRGQSNAFAGDSEALAIAQQGIIAGFDKELSFFERVFYYLPFEHSEDLKKQKMSVALYTRLCDEAAPEHKTFAENYLEYAQAHYDIIERFDRFPHRNEILDRDSSEEEMAFLQTEGSRF